MENTEKKQPLVQVKNLCKYFEISRKETLKAVDDLTFDIYKGETVSLVGESGCGKSTTGRTMIKLYNPTSGNVYYDGKDIFSNENCSFYWGLTHGEMVTDDNGLARTYYHYIKLGGTKHKIELLLQYHPDCYEIEE